MVGNVNMSSYDFKDPDNSTTCLSTCGNANGCSCTKSPIVLPSCSTTAADENCNCVLGLNNGNFSLVGSEDLDAGGAFAVVNGVENENGFFTAIGFAISGARVCAVDDGNENPLVFAELLFAATGNENPPVVGAAAADATGNENPPVGAVVVVVAAADGNENPPDVMTPADGADSFAFDDSVPGFAVSQQTHFKSAALLSTKHTGQSHLSLLAVTTAEPNLNIAGGAIGSVSAFWTTEPGLSASQHRHFMHVSPFSARQTEQLHFFADAADGFLAANISDNVGFSTTTAATGAETGGTEIVLAPTPDISFDWMCEMGDGR